MTAVTLWAVLAQVPVVLVMTRAALLRHLHRARRLEMAGGALQLRVCAQQRKMRLLGVIKHPQRPAVGRMAVVAFLAQAALVNVIVRMALDALQRGLVEAQGRVALRAADDAMQSEQRVLGQVVVEDDVSGPRVLAMTGLAAAF